VIDGTFTVNSESGFNGGHKIDILGVRQCPRSQEFERVIHQMAQWIKFIGRTTYAAYTYKGDVSHDIRQRLLFLPWHTKYFQCSVLSANFFSVCGRLLRVVFAEEDAAVTVEPFVVDTLSMMDT
jgi:hypothetical protein